jgi:hypothetical protein
MSLRHPTLKTSTAAGFELYDMEESEADFFSCFFNWHHARSAVLATPLSIID